MASTSNRTMRKAPLTARRLVCLSNSLEDPVTEQIVQYYEAPAVYDRLVEFLGVDSSLNATATYIVGGDGVSAFSQPAACTALNTFTTSGAEIERSLWDRAALIADIDLDYENFDSPAAAYLDPERALQLLQPVLEATLDVLAASGIRPLIALGGRGYHLVWAIDRSTPTFEKLAALGRVPPTLTDLYSRRREPEGVSVDSLVAKAFTGLGMLMEFVAQSVLRVVAAQSIVPVQLTSVEVGPGPHGREIISIDISEYGDALDTRHIRIPFSVYLKPRGLAWMLGEDGVRSLLPIFEIPVPSEPLARRIAISRDPDAVIRLASATRNIIPDQSAGTGNLLCRYQQSDLAGFHQRFYAQPFPQGYGEWHDERHAALIVSLPPCVRSLMEDDGDWLLKPAEMQLIARVLLSLGRQPFEIAELIAARLRRAPSLAAFFERQDPVHRAVFYTRIFTGLVATGLDELLDLNCVSQKEKGFCVRKDCSCNLADFRAPALAERKLL